jgi:hypothetical protein
MRRLVAIAGLWLVSAFGVAAHGALAVGQKTADGMPIALTANVPSAEQAKARALRLCGRALAATERARRVACRVEALFENQCAAVASDKLQTNIGWAVGGTKEEAFAIAKAKCEGAADSGVRCLHYLSECDISARP